ncbi:MAG: hypothetical protein ACOX6T_20245 [Myxococcales bacterium]
MNLGGRLFWQVYLHGVLLVLVVAVAVAVTGAIAGHSPPWREQAERLSAALSARAGLIDTAPGELERDLQAYGRLFGVALTVY